MVPQFLQGVHETFEWPWPWEWDRCFYDFHSRKICKNILALPIIFVEKLALLPWLLIALMPSRVHSWAWLFYKVSLKACQSIPVFIFRPVWLLATGVLTSRRPKCLSATKAENGSSVSAPSKKEEALARLLIWDIVILIANNVHYADIVSLACTSKHIRETILPVNERLSRLASLRRHVACVRLPPASNSSSLSSCEGCAITTCAVSAVSPFQKRSHTRKDKQPSSVSPEAVYPNPR